MNIPGFGIFLDIYSVLTRNPITGGFEVDGEAVPPAEPIAWADFIQLDWTQLGGLFYLVTDVHSVGSTGGSLWMADATGDRPVLKDGPLQYATLALAPDPTDFPGLRVFPADVGHVCKSDGTRYRIEDWEVVLKNTLTSTPHGGTFSTEAILQSVPFPVDINNNSIVADGDIIQVYSAWAEKTGTVNSMTRRYLLGTSTTVGDYTNAASGEVLTTTDAAGSAVGRKDALFDIIRVSATTVLINGIATQTATFSPGGAFAAAHNSAVTTTTSFDSATPPSLHYGLKLNGTTDTALALRRGYRVKLLRGY